MNAVSKTAYFCCGVRAEDARSDNPICADIYAEDFMHSEAKALFSRFSDSPKQNVSNVVRSRIFQDEIALRLKTDKNLQVVNIGAGFDTRAFRLAGGRWFEIDEPAIIQEKEARLPASRCPNPLVRIAVDFSKGELDSALQQCDPSANTLLVIEGVFMYLEKPQVVELLKTLSIRLPRHTLLCDLMNRTFFEKHMGKTYQRIRELGSEFKLLEHQPEMLFLHAGYQPMREPVSIVGRARDFKAIAIPNLLFKTALKSLRDGYRLHVFETAMN
ncbi:MAG TPA: class I SAM-dependent methyltransferase [Dongiaceae bacterium]|nr:class I SAM-dependent methyltransferase [Dongiaceae bacterium]